MSFPELTRARKIVMRRQLDRHVAALVCGGARSAGGRGGGGSFKRRELFLQRRDFVL